MTKILKNIRKYKNIWKIAENLKNVKESSRIF